MTVLQCLHKANEARYYGNDEEADLWMLLAKWASRGTE